MASSSILADHLMHKNRLQEYTQKSSLPLPIYRTENEGFVHAPKFRATVLVDGMEYTSKLTFSQRKAAEQEVARFAFECIKKKMKSDGSSNIQQDSMLSKSILYEFAIKKNLKVPLYKTTSPQGPAEVYVSTLAFNGKTYTSDEAGSKKMAEQLAAHIAIQSLLGSDSGDILAQIIKSKAKHFLTVKLPKASESTENVLPIAVQEGNSSRNLNNIPNSRPCRRMMSRCNERKRTIETSWNREAKRMERLED